MNDQLDVFETTIQKTNQILKSIEEGLSWEGRRHQSYQLLRAVLHALRDRLPIHDVTALGAQLPMLVRGFYFEGWDPSETPTKMNREEFIDRILGEIAFPLEGDVENLIREVMSAIRLAVDPQELEKIRHLLPENFGDLFA